MYGVRSEGKISRKTENSFEISHIYRCDIIPRYYTSIVFLSSADIHSKSLSHFLALKIEWKKQQRSEKETNIQSQFSVYLSFSAARWHGICFVVHIEYTHAHTQTHERNLIEFSCMHGIRHFYSLFLLRLFIEITYNPLHLKVECTAHCMQCTHIFAPYFIQCHSIPLVWIRNKIVLSTWIEFRLTTSPNKW